MRKPDPRWLAPFALLLLCACTTMPSGPGVMVLPGTGKSFEQFRADEFECRQYASAQTGTTPGEARADSAVGSAAVGTVIGALAGGAIGGSRGAAAGAGTGLIVGAAAGAGAGEQSGYRLQQRYDFAFQQCMYAKGHKVPASGHFAGTQRRSAPMMAPPPSPPPPG